MSNLLADFQKLGIKQKVKVRLMGKWKAELYVESSFESELLNILRNNDIETIPNFQRHSHGRSKIDNFDQIVIDSLGYLYFSDHRRGIRTAILEDFPLDMQNKIRSKANELQAKQMLKQQKRNQPPEAQVDSPVSDNCFSQEDIAVVVPEHPVGLDEDRCKDSSNTLAPSSSTEEAPAIAPSPTISDPLVSSSTVKADHIPDSRTAIHGSTRHVMSDAIVAIAEPSSPKGSSPVPSSSLHGAAEEANPVPTTTPESPPSNTPPPTPLITSNDDCSTQY
jgi:hypothetical protein